MSRRAAARYLGLGSEYTTEHNESKRQNTGKTFPIWGEFRIFGGFLVKKKHLYLHDNLLRRGRRDLKKGKKY